MMKHFLLTCLVLFVSAVAHADPPPVTDSLKLWLSADVISEVTDGQRVTRWPDRAVDFMPHDGAQDALPAYTNPPGFGGAAPRPFEPLAEPVFVADASGHPAVRFGKSGPSGLRHIGGIGLRGTDGGDAFTIFLVARSAGQPGVARVFQLGDVEGTGEDGVAASSAAIDLNAQASASSGIRFQNGNLMIRNADVAEADTIRIVTARLDSDDTYGQAGFTVNGRATPTSSAHPERLTRLRDEGYGLGFGNNAKGEPDGFFVGDLYEVLYFQRALTSDEIERTNRWLAAKYRLTDQLTQLPSTTTP